MSTWTRVTVALPPAGLLVRVCHVPPDWHGVRFTRALISAADGSWVVDLISRTLGGTITHWAIDDDLDGPEKDWALAHARAQETAQEDVAYL